MPRNRGTTKATKRDSKLPQYRDFDLDAFSAQVQSAFEAYDPQLLTNIDSAKKVVLSRIIEFKGDNDFNYHRSSGELRCKKLHHPDTWAHHDTSRLLYI